MKLRMLRENHRHYEGIMRDTPHRTTRVDEPVSERQRMDMNVSDERGQSMWM